MAERNFSITLKRGKGFEDPWLVITADSAEEAKAHIEAALGVDPGTHEETPLVNLVGVAAKSFQSAQLVEDILGGAEIGLGAGKPVTEKKGGGSEDSKPAPVKKSATRKAPAKKEAEPKEDAPEKAPEPPWDTSDPILEDISKAESVTSLRRVWARHKGQWDKEKHGPALEARKKELGG